MLRQRLALALLVTLAGCSPADPSSLSRDEARSMAGSAADSGRDLCEDYGWYGDGEFCDEFCPRTDP
ncbi:MAG: hypothetical protein KC621_04355, partial [Myxococcales bacterium]|nr:hypothetical protein [Myxococcales bacterium]